MFKLQKITAEQVAKLPAELKKDYKEIKSDTEDFDLDFYVDEIAEDDKDLHEKIMKELKKEDATEQANIQEEFIVYLNEAEDILKEKYGIEDVEKFNFLASDAQDAEKTPAKFIEDLAKEKGWEVLKEKTRSKAVKANNEINTKYQIGDKRYRHNGTEVEILDIKPKGKKFVYKLSDTNNFVSQNTVDRLLTQKPTSVAEPKIVEQNKLSQASKVKGLNWRVKLPAENYEQLEEVVIVQTYRKWVSTSEILVEVKNVAKKGDIILINEDGYPTKVLTATMANKHLRVGNFEKIYVRKTTYDEAKAKIELLEKRLEKETGEKIKAQDLFKKSSAAKRAARTRKKNVEQVEMVRPEPTTIQKILGVTPKPEKKVIKRTTNTANQRIALKPSGTKVVELPKNERAKKIDKTTIAAATKDTEKATAKPINKKETPKKRKCTADEFTAAQLTAKVVDFLAKNTMDWYKIGEKGKNMPTEILGIYKTKDTNEIIVKIKDYSGLFGSTKWYKLCLEKYTLVKTTEPKSSKRNHIIKKAQLDKIYSAKGAGRWQKCLKLHQELVKCTADGNCTETDKKKWKEIENHCGIIAKKIELLPNPMAIIHAEAKAIRAKKPRRSYADAVKAASIKLKEVTSSSAA